ncbi:MAG: crotonase/enoyl-CoA hydratase family protein [Acidimicrobiales bacterium]
MTTIGYESTDHIATITIDRPDARNAVNADVATGIEEALDNFENDPDTWVAILTGAGPVFCAGADLKAIAAGQAASIATKRGGFAGFVARERSKPVIAAVNGHALAGGCEILLACDLAVVADNALIGLPEVKRSLVAAAGALFRLPLAVSPALAAEMILTGDPITAEQALAAGLVNSVVPASEVMAAARDLAERIAVNAPLAVQASRKVMREALAGDSEPQLFRSSGEAIASLANTEDFAEGPRAFIEKRPPEWKGR